MKNTDYSQNVYYRNELVNYIDFNSSFESINYEGKKETRISIVIGTSILNININDLNN